MDNRNTQDILNSVLNSMGNNVNQNTEMSSQNAVDLPDNFESLSDDERVRLVMEQLQNLSVNQRQQVDNQEDIVEDTPNSDMGLLRNQIERRDEDTPNSVSNILNTVANNVNRQLSQGYVSENCIKSNYSEGYKDSINEYALLKSNKTCFDGFNFDISDDDEVYFTSVESTIEGTMKAIMGKKDIGDRVNSKLKECLKTNYVTNNVFSSGDSYMYFRNGLLNIVFKKDDSSDLQKYDVEEFDNLFNLITVYYSSKDSNVYFIYTDELMYDAVKLREYTEGVTNTSMFY